jgi:hypothetical protein
MGGGGGFGKMAFDNIARVGEGKFFVEREGGAW